MAWIRRWEDRHADVEDYRMGHMTGGLFQAAQSMREILDGVRNPMYGNGQVGTVGKAWMTDQKVGERYVAELFSNVPIPVNPSTDALSTNRQNEVQTAS